MRRRLGANELRLHSVSPKPLQAEILDCFPNPFNSTITIKVGLPESSELKLTVYNITGQEVAVLANEKFSEGYHQFTFNADNLSSGIYFVQAIVPGKLNEIKKVVLIR